jgi:hypothetical protein
MSAQDRRDLVQFVKGKQIVGLRFDADTEEDESRGIGIEFIFDDGSELDLYCLPRDRGDNDSCTFGWVTLSPEEASEK